MPSSRSLSAADSRGLRSGRRLVQAQELRLGAHCAGNLEPPLRAVGQVARWIVGPLDQLRALQPVPCKFDRLGGCLAVAAETQKAENRVAGCEHQLVVLGDQKVFQHGHAGEQPDVLERAGDLRLRRDLEVRHAFQQELASVLAAHGDHARGRLVEAGDAVEHGRLAGAVGADQGGDLAALCRKVEIVDGNKAAKAHRKMLHLEDVAILGCNRFHHPCPSLVKLPDTLFRS